MKPKCIFCKKDIERSVYPSGRVEGLQEYFNRKFCNKRCYHKFYTHDRHPNWKGGIRRGHDWGYLRYTDGSYIHRKVMEKHLGRELRKDEFVHHINEDSSDNRIENLQIMSNSEHSKLHMKNRNKDKLGRFIK